MSTQRGQQLITMAEEAKIARRSARAKFTRKRNDFQKSVRDRNNLDTIEENYSQLVDSWNDLEGKHENYTSYLSDDEFEAAENWMNELQALYTDAKNLRNEYIHNLKIEETRAREEIEHHETMRKEKEQCERMQEHVLNKRENARTVFDAIYINASHALESEHVATTLMRKVQTQLEAAFVECKQKHEQYLELIDRETAQRELHWISALLEKNGLNLLTQAPV